MKPQQKKMGLTLGMPANYRICVQGGLHKSWSDRLSGMRLAVDAGENHPPVTTLVGQVRDQGELLGVLNSLYELHLPLLSVEVLPKKYRRRQKTKIPFPGASR